VSVATATLAGEELLSLRGVTKRFGGVTALEGIDFDVRAGEVHALVGENGAGKSTLMKVIDGLHRPDEGELVVRGEPASFSSVHDAEAAGIAMIPQELELFPELSVVENLYVGRARPRRRLGTFDGAAMRAQAEEVFASLGVEVDVSAPVRRLSTANRQLVEIARALIRDAAVVIMDEPTAALTDREAERLFGVIRDLTRRGVGVVYISHRLEEVFALADRITVIRDGRHVATAPAAELQPDELVRLMVGRPVSQLFARTPAPVGDVALELRGLTREGEFADVDLTLRRGEVVTLAGLIGAGRTELAQTVFGLRAPDRGEILVDGRPVEIGSPEEALARGIAYVPEERRSQGLVLPFSISWNIASSSLRSLSRLGFVQRRGERDLAARYAQSLSIRGAGLADPVQRLSGGNQQKVLVAKSLAREPAILLLDEPTRGVDIGAKAEIYGLIDDLARQGRAILVISSELAEVLALGDRVVVLREGRVVAELARGEVTQEAVGAAAAGVTGAGVR
jgi:ABC-type sugar transport system ATPase subunit